MTLEEEVVFLRAELKAARVALANHVAEITRQREIIFFHEHEQEE